VRLSNYWTHVHRLIDLTLGITMASGGEEEKVLSWGDYILRRKDLRLLEGPTEWLNDTLIGFYFQYLFEKKGDKGLAFFVGPEVTQLLKLLSKEEVPIVLKEVGDGMAGHKYTFFPVNDSVDPNRHSGGSHWSLLIYSKVDEAFVHFDSCHGSNEPDARTLVQKLSVFVPNQGSTKFISSPSCLPQVNGFDCGCHVLRNAELILDHVKGTPDASITSTDVPSATPFEAAAVRLKLAELIKKLARKSSGLNK